MTLTPIPDGTLAAIVTYLEMRERPASPDVATSGLRLQQIGSADPGHYRDLFRAVGADWLWFSRLEMADDELAGILSDPAVDLFEVRDGDQVAGMLELDFRLAGECEIAFVGLMPDHAGKGHGRWLLAEAVRRAWRSDVRRVHVHTCSLDHPAALAAYRRAGFVPVSRALETFIDPRLAGLLPRDAAPQVALLAPVDS